MRTWAPRWAFFGSMTALAIGSAYAAARQIGDAAAGFRIGAAAVALAGLATTTAGLVGVWGSVAVGALPPAWELIVWTAFCGLFLTVAASLPFVDRELRRRDRADREWAAQRPLGGR